MEGDPTCIGERDDSTPVLGFWLLVSRKSRSKNEESKSKSKALSLVADEAGSLGMTVVVEATGVQSKGILRYPQNDKRALLFPNFAINLRPSA